MAEALRLEDDPWRRLPWLTALALVITFGALMGFMRLLEQPPNTLPPPRHVEVQVVEIPPTMSPAPAAIAPSPPAPTKRAPAARPKREVVRPPAPPPPRPEPEVKPPAEPAPPEPEVPAPSVAAPAPAPQTSAPPRPAVPQEEGTVGPSRPLAPPQLSPPPTSSAIPPGTGPGAPGGAPGGGGQMGARAIYKPLPEVPESLRRQSLDVVAVARFRVAANGTADVELVQPTSDPGLNAALLDSLKRWRFFPAMREGKPVASTVDIRIPVSVR